MGSTLKGLGFAAQSEEAAPALPPTSTEHSAPTRAACAGTQTRDSGAAKHVFESHHLIAEDGFSIPDVCRNK